MPEHTTLAKVIIRVRVRLRVRVMSLEQFRSDLPTQISAHPRSASMAGLRRPLKSWGFGLEGPRWQEWPQGSMPVSRILRVLESTK